MFVWVGKEADDVIVIGRVVSAELRLCWPSCVCIDRVALNLSCRSSDSEFLCHINTIQSTLVISTSVISNNRLSRRKNLVIVITQKSKIRL